MSSLETVLCINKIVAFFLTIHIFVSKKKQQTNEQNQPPCKVRLLVKHPDKLGPYFWSTSMSVMQVPHVQSWEGMPPEWSCKKMLADQIGVLCWKFRV